MKRDEETLTHNTTEGAVFRTPAETHENNRLTLSVK